MHVNFSTSACNSMTLSVLCYCLVRRTLICCCRFFMSASLSIFHARETSSSHFLVNLPQTKQCAASMWLFLTWHHSLMLPMSLKLVQLPWHIVPFPLLFSLQLMLLLSFFLPTPMGVYWVSPVPLTLRYFCEVCMLFH